VGLEGARAWCNDLASEAGLSGAGEFYPLLSGPAYDARSLGELFDGRLIYNRNNQMIAATWALLWDERKLLTAVRYDEQGRDLFDEQVTRVFTGTTRLGYRISSDPADFCATPGVPPAQWAGAAGLTTTGNVRVAGHKIFEALTNSSCTGPGRIYCIGNVDQPTPAPANTQTPQPTATPTETATPTATMSATPTQIPTATATLEPTQVPTVAPTQTFTPSPQPTFTPSVTPTTTPSSTPTPEPARLAMNIRAARAQLSGAGAVAITVEISNAGGATKINRLNIELPGLGGAQASVLTQSVVWNGAPLLDAALAASPRVTVEQLLDVPARVVTKFNFVVYVQETVGTVFVVVSARPHDGGTQPGSAVVDPLAATLSIEQRGPQQKVGKSVIMGQVLSADTNQPLQDVIVRAFSVVSQAASSGSFAVNGELGSQSVRTDATGTYRFDDLGSGQHRIQPQFSELQFFPPDIVVEAGTVAPEFAGMIAVAKSAPRCQATPRSDLLINADAAAKALQNLGISLADFYRLRLVREVEPLVRDRLTRASGMLQRAFTVLLNLGEELPTVEYRCPETVRCEERSLLAVLDRYNTYLAQMRRINFLILRTARQSNASLPGTDWSRLSFLVRRHHQRAVRAWRRLPRQELLCP
jgi:hypothetical protein